MFPKVKANQVCCFKFCTKVLSILEWSVFQNIWNSGVSDELYKHEAPDNG